MRDAKGSEHPDGKAPLDRAEALATASLWASVHNLRILVNRGLASPNEVDEIYGSIIEAIQNGDADFAVRTEAALQGVFVDLKAYAEKLWMGKGQTNPR